MFDANARGIPVGRKFFVEAWDVNQNYTTYKKLLKEGNIYLCERIGGDEHTTLFRLYLNKTCKDYIVIKEDFNNEEMFDYESWFVYSGCPDGTGFICNNWKAEALDFLGGNWYA